MRKRTLRWSVFYRPSLLLVLAVFLADHAYGADGNQLYAFGAIQKGMGGGGAASPQDATWTLMNPASIVDLGKRLDFSIEYLYAHVTADPGGLFLVSNPGTGTMRFDANNIFIPSLGVIWPLDKGDHGTLGMGMIGEAGNRTDYHHARSTLAIFNNGDRRAAEETAKMPLAYAYKFSNGVAIGAAVIPAFNMFRTDSLTLKLRTTKGNNRNDMAVGAGAALGIYKHWEKFGIGASYTSRTWMTNFHKYEHDLTTTPIDLPQQIQAGVSYRPWRPLEFVLDYKWIDWDAINLFGHETIRGGLGWKDQHLVKGGVLWDITGTWTARAGFSYGNTAVTARHAFANIMTPALASTHLGLGVSHKLSKHSVVHLSYSQCLPERRIENGRGDIFSHLGKGSMVSFQEHSLTAQYTYQF